jgi:hypothetical protein
VWRKDELSSHHFFVTVYPEFGHAEVARLEADFARFMRPQDIGPMLRERAEARRLRALAANKQYRADKVVANKSRLHDLVFGDDDRKRYGYREAKAFGYADQSKRTSTGESGLVRTDSHLDGWEG